MYLYMNAAALQGVAYYTSLVSVSASAFRTKLADIIAVDPRYISG